LLHLFILFFNVQLFIFILETILVGTITVIAILVLIIMSFIIVMLKQSSFMCCTNTTNTETKRGNEVQYYNTENIQPNTKLQSTTQRRMARNEEMQLNEGAYEAVNDGTEVQNDNQPEYTGLRSEAREEPSVYTGLQNLL
jgi:hypothetical protein